MNLALGVFFHWLGGLSRLRKNLTSKLGMDAGIVCFSLRHFCPVHVARGGARVGSQDAIPFGLLIPRLNSTTFTDYPQRCFA